MEEMNRKAFLWILILLIPIGLSTKFYRGVFEDWVHLYAGDIFYPMFWYVLLRMLWGNTSRFWCAVLVLSFCTLIEVSQLWKPSFLQVLRQTFVGAVILGSGFDWLDLVYYVAGIGLAVGIEQWITSKREA